MTKATIETALLDLLGDEDQVAEAIGEMESSTDFTVGDYRFIHTDHIDSVLAEELSSDEYVLGCFNASFIAHVTGWPIKLIEVAQKGDAYSELGAAIIQEGYIEDMASQYASADGYGHHFASYDGHEHEIGDKWLAFRIG